MDGLPLCLAELNAQVTGWLRDIDEKQLVQFSESRSDRFLREKAALRPLPIDSCDVREQIAVAVNRESMISYQTNSYSAPPEHIGQVLMLNVDPLSHEAELCGPQGAVRTFVLAAAGARQRIVFPEDREAMHERWKQDRTRAARRRAPRRRQPTPAIDVEVRSPADYEPIVEAMGREACA
jgi:hypothetical protein